MSDAVFVDEHQMCDRFQRDLTAYASLVIDGREEEADQRYPELVLHLLSCRDCAETYRLLMVLEDATVRGELPTLPRTAPPPRRPVVPVRQLVLKRTTVHQLLRPIASQLGPPRGDTTHAIVVGIEETDDVSLTVSAQQEAGGEWAVTLVSDPEPAPFPATLMVGELTIMGTRQVDGSVVFPVVPGHLLTDVEGSDVVITLE